MIESGTLLNFINGRWDVAERGMHGAGRVHIARHVAVRAVASRRGDEDVFNLVGVEPVEDLCHHF